MAVDERKVALITGCSEPISLGANTALALHERGYRVFASARNIKTLEPLRVQGLDVLALDVTSEESIAAAVETITAAAGRLDVLVNNAGVAGRAAIVDADMDRVRAMFEVNVFGPMALTSALAPLLVAARGASGRDSVVVNIGSGVVLGYPFLGAYSASKAALQTWSDTLRRELSALHVKVITVELMLVRTALGKGEKPFVVVKDKPLGLYDWAGIVAYIKTVMGGAANHTATTSEDAARDIVKAIVAPNPPGKLWTGGGTFLARWVVPFLPRWYVDFKLCKMFGKGKAW
ncbi:NADPH-dependent 1-acyldihydroxyacetone phosphate reductase [Vanrija pseudolonga]|uniref:NADPH-dependent 1-acyldihydroxyacetone phosphate reductase n=1 Tax=Vanrija pseudolonga TaxID=143232 RepID=A0AAF0Y937_9TREE|nr:NADPH-dependent 1-acyldihydroxyacetone phosphate reductase [Vanrija pseudolonga]